MTHKGQPTKTVFDRRTALKGIGVGLLGATALTDTVGAKPGKGKSAGNGSCDIVVPDDYGTIQEAVDKANSGDTVCVKDGTYAEQVLIDKSLSLRSAENSSPTIEFSDSSDAYTIPESGPTWEPMVFAFGGSVSDGEVSGSETIDVDLTGFTLDGLGEQPDARRKPAVLYRNVSGKIKANTVQKMGVGGKETFGILAYGDSEVTVIGNDVSEYERGGIGANGDGGEHPSPAAKIRDNSLTGSTGIGEAWGPNGIQLGFGATGDIKGNTVTDNRYSDEGPVAAGILIFESDGIKVQDNTVKNADIALSCGSWGWFQDSASNNKFVNNSVEDAEFGALLESVSEPYGGVLTQSDPEVNNNKVTNNTFKDDEETDDPDGNLGVGIIVEDNIDNEFEPEADNNKVIRNTVKGFDKEFEDEGTNSKVRAFKP